MHRTLRVLLLLLVAALASSPAMAQVRRCVNPSGAVVFTDHECSDIGAQEQAARPPSPSGGSRAAYRGCARTVHDLMYEMTSAFDSHDANRLAGVYHWTGMSGNSAYSILDRLDAMVQRPLVDLVPVMPAAPVGEGSADVGDVATSVDGEYYPQNSVRQAPVALRVEQTQANGITPSRTVFGLRKHLGCWWVQL
jgi:hypothetical protein